MIGLASGLEWLAYNPLVDMQAFRVKGHDFWSVQFHADLTGAEAQERYHCYRAGFEKVAGHLEPHEKEIYEIGEDNATILLSGFGDGVIGRLGARSE